MGNQYQDEFFIPKVPQCRLSAIQLLFIWTLRFFHSQRNGMRKLLAILSSATVILIPCQAIAEVSDKIPPITDVWVTGLVIGVMAAVLCFSVTYFHKRAGIALLAVLFIYMTIEPLYYGFIDEVGRYIYAEQGIMYFLPSYLVALFVLIGGMIGIKIKR
ncbi:MAG: hypothetical protein LBG78_10580 [Azoarcus sp.]|jgi:hypothetical protein|nr:hypothetical protein [Azoarcus sp.]